MLMEEGGGEKAEENRRTVQFWDISLKPPMCSRCPDWWRMNATNSECWPRTSTGCPIRWSCLNQLWPSTSSQCQANRTNRWCATLTAPGPSWSGSRRHLMEDQKFSATTSNTGINTHTNGSPATSS